MDAGAHAADLARIRNGLPVLALVALAMVVAGCMGPRESQEKTGDDVNNANQANGDRTGDAAQASGSECISTTTGEPTTDPAANPCPAGQYPSG